jgi:hypothetical protein
VVGVEGDYSVCLPYFPFDGDGEVLSEALKDFGK